MTQSTNHAEALALAAMAATLSDERRALRFLELSGLEAASLRERAISGDRALFAALIAFLEGHEPDLLDVAAALGTTPAALVAAGTELAQ